MSYEKARLGNAHDAPFGRTKSLEIQAQQPAKEQYFVRVWERLFRGCP